MNRRIALLAALFGVGCTTSEHLAVAEAQVPKFHRLVNEGNFEQIWYQATTQFQNAYSKEAFVALMLTMKRDLGNVQSTERQGWQALYQGAGVQVTLSLRTKFERGEALETLGYRVESGAAFLTVFFVQSSATKRSDA